MYATTSPRRENQDDTPLGRSINAAAVSAGLGVWTIRAALNSGALRGRKAGRRTIILDADLHTWLSTLPFYVAGGQS